MFNETTYSATMLRQGIKQHYGIRSEKLAEFGMQPFRGKKEPVKSPGPHRQLTARQLPI